MAVAAGEFFSESLLSCWTFSSPSPLARKSKLSPMLRVSRFLVFPARGLGYRRQKAREIHGPVILQVLRFLVFPARGLGFW